MKIITVAPTCSGQSWSRQELQLSPGAVCSEPCCPLSSLPGRPPPRCPLVQGILLLHISLPGATSSHPLTQTLPQPPVSTPHPNSSGETFCGPREGQMAFSLRQSPTGLSCSASRALPSSQSSHHQNHTFKAHLHDGNLNLLVQKRHWCPKKGCGCPRSASCLPQPS